MEHASEFLELDTMQDCREFNGGKRGVVGVDISSDGVRRDQRDAQKSSEA